MINWAYKGFDNLQNFELVTWTDLLKRLNVLIDELYKDGYVKDHNIEPCKISLENKESITFSNSTFHRNNELGFRHISLDIGAKTTSRKFYEEGYFIYYEMPNSLLRKLTSHLHQPDTTFINEFINEVTWFSDKANYNKKIKEWDKRYPTKISSHKLEGEFKWRSNFNVNWWYSMLIDGFITPLILFDKHKTFLTRGTHRAWMLGQLGYNYPIFFPFYNKNQRRKIITQPLFYRGEPLTLYLSNTSAEWYRENKLIYKDEKD